jgi:hypothetical protein
VTIHSAYALYGIRIPDGQNFEALDEDPGQWRTVGSVGYFSAGPYDNDLYFLTVKVVEIELGYYHLITRDSMFMERKDQAIWNDDLRLTAERLRLPEVDDPGWYFVPDEA